MIISTTLCGARDAALVADALRYASLLADAHAVIWTGDGPIPDELLLAAAATSGETTFHTWRWTGSFADARNVSLDIARELGAAWSVMIDADERIVCPDAEAARTWLAALADDVSIVCAHTFEGTYTRERFFRGNLDARWHLRTHEGIDAPAGSRRAWIPRTLLAWSEIPKTVEDVAVKCARDLALLDADLLELPDGPPARRVMFYKGQTLEHMGRVEEAIACYRAVAKGNAGEGAAWACYCAALLYLRLSPPNLMESLNACWATLQREPRLAEPYWLAGRIYHDLGHYEWAIAYEEMAKLHASHNDQAELGGFREPAALGDGPQWVINVCREAIAKRGAAPMSAAGAAAAAQAVDIERRAGMGIYQERVDQLAGVAGVTSKRLHITVTGTGFRAAEWAAKCIESVARQTVRADHIYIAADDETFAAARAVKSDAVDGRGQSAFDNLVPLWGSLPDEEIVVWLDGDDWLFDDHALERVLRAHEAGALMTYGQFRWSSTGEIGFAAPHDHTLPRASSPWRATILRTFRAGLVRRIKDEDLRWPKLDAPGARGTYGEIRRVSLSQLGYDASDHPARSEDFAGKWIDATLDQAIMLPCLEMAGPDRAVFIPEVLAVYNDVNLRTMNDATRFHEREALLYIRSRAPYERIDRL